MTSETRGQITLRQQGETLWSASALGTMSPGISAFSALVRLSAELEMRAEYASSAMAAEQRREVAAHARAWAEEVEP